MGNYKRDWTARKPFFILQKGDKYLVIVNERKLITTTPHLDLIASLEEMIATAKEQYASNTLS